MYEYGSGEERPGAITRRRLLRDGAVAGAVAATAAPAAAASHRRGGAPSVAVLGGGVAGLSAAHELAERGFRVTVYERRAFGGKARSMGAPATAGRGRRRLPGEHGMRFFPGFYENLPDTMRRIPFGSDPKGTFGNLVAVPELMLARAGGREDLVLPVAAESTQRDLPELRRALTASIETAVRLPPQEAAWFVDRLTVFFTSCDARRLGEWEHRSWEEFTGARSFSEEYRRVLVDSVTRQLLAAKASAASARTLGLLWEAFIYNAAGQSGTGSFDRVLDAPTNEAWIAPWTRHLRALGVRLRRGVEVDSLAVRGGRIAGARARGSCGRFRIEADWFVLAVPVERARPLLRGAAAGLDPRLGGLGRLQTDWMNGIQFYLREPTPIVRGHVLHLDSPWALASLSQAQFWAGRDFRRDYGDGSVRDCVSVDIGDFDEPGIVYGRPASALGERQIAREVWAQLKAHLNDTGEARLRDEMLVRWFIDPGLQFRKGRPRSIDPLLINTPGSWDHRPPPATAIPNLVLASDYVQVETDLACMEAANEAARHAVNVLLARAGSREAPVHVYGRYRPPALEPFKAADEERFALGLPNTFDTPQPPSLPG